MSELAYARVAALSRENIELKARVAELKAKVAKLETQNAILRKYMVRPMSEIESSEDSTDVFLLVRTTITDTMVVSHGTWHGWLPVPEDFESKEGGA